MSAAAADPGWEEDEGEFESEEGTEEGDLSAESVDEWWTENTGADEGDGEDEEDENVPDVAEPAVHRAMSKKARKRLNARRRQAVKEAMSGNSFTVESTTHVKEELARPASIERAVPSLVDICLATLTRSTRGDMELIPLDLLERVSRLLVDKKVIPHERSFLLHRCVHPRNLIDDALLEDPAIWRDATLNHRFILEAADNDSLLSAYISSSLDQPSRFSIKHFNEALASVHLNNHTRYHASLPRRGDDEYRTFIPNIAEGRVLEPDTPLQRRAIAICHARVGAVDKAAELLTKLVDEYIARYDQQVIEDAATKEHVMMEHGGQTLEMRQRLATTLTRRADCNRAYYTGRGIASILFLLASIYHSFGHSLAALRALRAAEPYLRADETEQLCTLGGAMLQAQNVDSMLLHVWDGHLGRPASVQYRRLCEYFIARGKHDALITFLLGQRSVFEEAQRIELARVAAEGARGVPPRQPVAQGIEPFGAEEVTRGCADAHPAYHLALVYALEGNMGRAQEEWQRLRIDHDFFARLSVMRPPATRIRAIPVRWRFFASAPTVGLARAAVPAPQNSSFRCDGLVVRGKHVHIITYDRSRFMAPVVCVDKRAGTMVPLRQGQCVSRIPWHVPSSQPVFQWGAGSQPYTLVACEGAGVHVMVDFDPSSGHIYAYRPQWGNKLLACNVSAAVMDAYRTREGAILQEEPYKLTGNEVEAIFDECARLELIPFRALIAAGIGRLRERTARHAHNAKEERKASAERRTPVLMGENPRTKYTKWYNRARRKNPTRLQGRTRHLIDSYNREYQKELDNLFVREHFRRKSARLSLASVHRVGARHVLLHVTSGLLPDPDTLSAAPEDCPPCVDALVMLSCTSEPGAFTKPTVLLADFNEYWLLPERPTSLASTIPAAVQSGFDRHVVMSRVGKTHVTALIFESATGGVVATPQWPFPAFIPKLCLGEYIYGLWTPDALNRYFIARAPIAHPDHIDTSCTLSVRVADLRSRHVQRLGSKHLLVVDESDPADVHILDADLQVKFSWREIRSTAQLKPRVMTEHPDGRALIAMSDRVVVFDGERGLVLKELLFPLAAHVGVFTPFGVLISTAHHLDVDDPPYAAIYWFDNDTYALRGSHEYVVMGANGMAYDEETACAYFYDHAMELVCLNIGQE